MLQEIERVSADSSVTFYLILGKSFIIFAEHGR